MKSILTNSERAQQERRRREGRSAAPRRMVMLPTETVLKDLEAVRRAFAATHGFTPSWPDTITFLLRHWEQTKDTDGGRRR